MATESPRIKALKGIAKQLSGRLDNIERTFAARFESIERALEEVRRQQVAAFRWLVGIQITTLLALGTLILSLHR